MRVLHVGGVDEVGRRFNGSDLHLELKKRGWESSHCVWRKKAADEDTWELSRWRFKNSVMAKISKWEYEMSLRAVLPPFSWKLAVDESFKKADVVHYQLIESGFFSLLSLLLLTKLKPTVWTLHNMWPFTGHCVHAYDCPRWRIGCGKCPDLGTDFKMKRDRTALMWGLKDYVYNRSTVELVVASDWMRKRVRKSLLLNQFRVHQIPFGLDLEEFKPRRKREARRQLGVEPGRVVLGFRASPDEFKGIGQVKKCLAQLRGDRRICLVNFQERGLFKEFEGKFQLIELGWVDNSELLVRAYNAMDLYLMPSRAESFGMMAVEAMACGVPVVGFDGTALPETIEVPRGGVTVPQGDAQALAKVIEELLEDEQRYEKLSDSARKLAEEKYDIRRYVEEHVKLYEGVVERRRDKAGGRG